MNHNTNYEQWLNYLIITIALLLIGYLIGKQVPHPDKAAAMPVENETVMTRRKSQQELNMKQSK